MNRAFSADGFWADEPRALPWAGMNDALGVSHMSRLPPCTSARPWLVPKWESAAQALWLLRSTFRQASGVNFGFR